MKREDAIEAVYNILSVERGEMPLNREIGLNVGDPQFPIREIINRLNKYYSGQMFFSRSGDNSIYCQTFDFSIDIKGLI